MCECVSVGVSVDGGQAGARQDHGTTGPRDHGTTGPSQHTEGSPGPPILDPETHDLSQAGDEARGQTGARRDHGTIGAHRTGPPHHRFWIGETVIRAIIN